MIKNKNKKTRGGGKKTTLDWSPLRHSLPQNTVEPRWDWAHVQRHYRGTWGANDLFSLLGACSNYHWRLWGVEVTTWFNGVNEKQDQIQVNWTMESGGRNATGMNKIRLFWHNGVTFVNSALFSSVGAFVELPHYSNIQLDRVSFQPALTTKSWKSCYIHLS